MSQLFTNPASIVMLRMIRGWSVSPSLITLLAFFVGAFSVALILNGSVAALVAGGILVQVSFVLDGLDGTYARFARKTSYFGAWLDRVLDRIVDVGLVAALGLSRHAAPALTALALLSLIFLWRTYDVSVIASRMMGTLADSRFGRIEAACAARGVRFTFGRDIFLWTISLGCFFGNAEFALSAIVAASCVNAIWRYFSFGVRA
jgi:phosphatidylglycerophosphate synthase